MLDACPAEASNRSLQSYAWEAMALFLSLLSLVSCWLLVVGGGPGGWPGGGPGVWWFCLTCFIWRDTPTVQSPGGFLIFLKWAWDLFVVHLSVVSLLVFFSVVAGCPAGNSSLLGGSTVTIEISTQAGWRSLKPQAPRLTVPLDEPRRYFNQGNSCPFLGVIDDHPRVLKPG